MSLVSRHVWTLDARTALGMVSNVFRLRELHIARPLAFLKHVQFSLRRPQQFKGICREAFDDLHCLGFAALRSLRCLGFALLLGFAALSSLRCLGFALLFLLFAALECLASRCLLMRSREQRRRLSVAARDSHLARGFCAVHKVSLYF